MGKKAVSASFLKKKAEEAKMQEKRDVRNAKRRQERQVVKLLTYARSLLEEKGWTKGAFARNKARRAVDSLSPDACSFCVIGSLERAGHDLDINFSIRMAAEDCIANVMWDRKQNRTVDEINDRRSTKKEHILMAFDLAILGAGK